MTKKEMTAKEAFEFARKEQAALFGAPEPFPEDTLDFDIGYGLELAAFLMRVDEAFAVLIGTLGLAYGRLVKLNPGVQDIDIAKDFGHYIIALCEGHLQKYDTDEIREKSEIAVTAFNEELYIESKKPKH